MQRDPVSGDSFGIEEKGANSLEADLRRKPRDPKQLIFSYQISLLKKMKIFAERDFNQRAL